LAKKSTFRFNKANNKNSTLQTGTHTVSKMENVIGSLASSLDIHQCTCLQIIFLIDGIYRKLSNSNNIFNIIKVRLNYKNN
jgi:hypothetical protein